jgi:hypothetical protein
MPTQHNAASMLIELPLTKRFLRTTGHSIGMKMKEYSQTAESNRKV